MLLWASRQLICNLVCAGAKGLACAQSATAHKALLAARHYSSKYSTTKAPYDPLPPGWEGVIGIEVHAQLKSARKLFSPAPVEGLSLTANDNDLVAPLDAALPGTLPSLQSEPLHLALRTALALDCEIASTVSFDRKHYFYSDLTSGYQITQKYGEQVSPPYGLIVIVSQSSSLLQHRSLAMGSYGFYKMMVTLLTRKRKLRYG